MERERKIIFKMHMYVHSFARAWNIARRCIVRRSVEKARGRAEQSYTCKSIVSRASLIFLFVYRMLSALFLIASPSIGISTLMSRASYRVKRTVATHYRIVLSFSLRACVRNCRKKSV